MEICPGQSMAFKDPRKMIYEVECPACHAQVEFWYDDKKRRCGCGETVQPDLETLMRYQSCSSYCASARECLGDDKYAEMALKELRPKELARKEMTSVLGMVPPDRDDIRGLLEDVMEDNAGRGYLADINNDFKDVDEGLRTDSLKILKRYILGEKG